jgi:hypothetical protein
MLLTVKNTSVPPGTYRARYVGGESLTTSFGEAYKIEFVVVGGPYDGKKTSRLVNPESTSPKLNIVKFFAALANYDVENGLEIDDSQHIGELYEICIEDHKDGYTKLAEIVRQLHAGEETDQEAEQTASELF